MKIKLYKKIKLYENKKIKKLFIKDMLLYMKTKLVFFYN